MVAPDVYELCRNRRSVTAELAKNPRDDIPTICKRLFDSTPTDHHDIHDKHAQAIDAKTRIEQAFECGSWGSSRPSELFLQIYSDVLDTLNNNPLAGACSPSLLGSNGVCPLTIISTIPDIARHMSNLIVRAERDVFIATNYWMLSEPSRIISNALRELSRRAVAGKRRVVVKVLYDRGAVKQFVRNHVLVSPAYFSNPAGPIALPHPDELPGVDIEAVNYHRPLLGTFHAKFMLVDRQIAILQSDNIQDNDNLEMMSQFEGPIVDSIYDTALMTWYHAMNPPLLTLDRPAAGQPMPSFEGGRHDALFDKHGLLVSDYRNSSDQADLTKVATEGSKLVLPQHTSADPHYDDDTAGEMLRSIAAMNPGPNERRIDVVARHLNTIATNETKATAPDTTDPSEIMTPLMPIAKHAPVPIALVNREPFGPPTLSNADVPQNAAFRGGLRYAKKCVLIQTPDLNAQALLPEILAAARRGIHISIVTCLGYNDAGELLPLQGGHNEMVAHKLYLDLEAEFHTHLDIYSYVAKDQRKPLHNQFRRRSCHIKLMIVDEHIGIMGSGNQDTQSWYHSQEINAMIDSPMVVGKWLEGIQRNQNTFKYGLARKGNAKEDELVGCWVDEDGKLAEGTIGIDPGRFSWFKGAIGAVNRVRGEGGF